MNDAVIKAAGGYAAVHLRLTALGADLGHLVADGLIAASAAGSTAYSLSAGGPLAGARRGGDGGDAGVPALARQPTRSCWLRAPSSWCSVLGSFDHVVLLLLDGPETAWASRRRTRSASASTRRACADRPQPRASVRACRCSASSAGRAAASGVCDVLERLRIRDLGTGRRRRGRNAGPGLNVITGRDRRRASRCSFSPSTWLVGERADSRLRARRREARGRRGRVPPRRPQPRDARARAARRVGRRSSTARR